MKGRFISVQDHYTIRINPLGIEMKCDGTFIHQTVVAVVATPNLSSHRVQQLFTRCHHQKDEQAAT
jgi:hypothetical protein